MFPDVGASESYIAGTCLAASGTFMLKLGEKSLSFTISLTSVEMGVNAMALNYSKRKKRTSAFEQCNGR